MGGLDLGWLLLYYDESMATTQKPGHLKRDCTLGQINHNLERLSGDRERDSQ